VLDRIIRLRRERASRSAAAADPSEPIEPIEALERRIAHLEGMIEGLQDAVHREITRTNNQIDELRRRTEPGELSRALSEEARERGL
jgi:uncharacterized coiled-coil protein SlyX